MKKNYLLLSLAVIVFISIVNTQKVSSKQGNPPANSTGDPVTGNTCVQSGCHGGSVLTPGSSDVTLNIGTGSPTTPLNAAFEYAGGTQYNIAMLLNSSTGRYGFQIVALNSSNAQAGTMTVTNAATTKINTSAGRQYMGHLNASTTKNWSFKWTAPVATTGPVTFYYCYATEDGDGNPGSNVIYKSSVTINAAASSVNDISTKLSDLNIFPNPVSNEFGLTFDLKQNSDVAVDLYTIDGKLSKQLINQKIAEGHFSNQFDISHLPTGVYLVNMVVDGVAETRKLFKQ